MSKTKIKKLKPKIKELADEDKSSSHEDKSELENEVGKEELKFNLSLINPSSDSDTTPLIHLEDIKATPRFRQVQTPQIQTAQTSQTIDANAPRDPYRLTQRNESGSYSTAIRQERGTSGTPSPAQQERQNFQRQLQRAASQANVFDLDVKNLERQGLDEQERQRQYEEKKREEERRKYQGG